MGQPTRREIVEYVLLINERYTNLGPLHTRAKSRDHEIVRAQKKSVQRLSQDTSKIM